MAGVADLIQQVGAYLSALPAVLVALTKGPAGGARPHVLHRLPAIRELHPGPAHVQELHRPLTPAVIISTLAGAILAGFAGALLALPIAATIKVIAVDVVLASRSNPPPDNPTTTGPATPNNH